MPCFEELLKCDNYLKKLATQSFYNVIKTAHRYVVQVSDTTMLPVAAAFVETIRILTAK